MHGPGRGAISAPLENLALGGRQLDFPSPTPAILPRPQHESFIPTHPYAIALASPPAPKPSPSPAPSPLEIQFGVAMASPAAGSQYYYAYPPAEDLRFPAGGSKRTGYVPYRKPSRDETESPPPPAPSSVRSDSLSAGTSPSSFEGTYASVPTTISSKEPRGFRGKPGFRDATGVLKGEDRGQQSGNRIHMRAGSAKETLREMMVGFIPPDVPPPNPSYPPSIYPLPPILEVLSPRPTEITMGVGVEIAEINNLKSAWDSDDEGGGKNKKKKKEAKWDKKRRRNPSERDRQEMEVLDTSLPDAEKLLNGPRFSVNTVMREVAGAQDRVKNGIDDRVLKSSPEENQGSGGSIRNLSQEVQALLTASPTIPAPSERRRVARGLRNLFKRDTSPPPDSRRAQNPPRDTVSNVSAGSSRAPRNRLHKRRPPIKVPKNQPLSPPSHSNDQNQPEDVSPLVRWASHDSPHELNTLSRSKDLRRTSSLPELSSPTMDAFARATATAVPESATSQIHPVIASLPVDRRLRASRARKTDGDRLRDWLKDIDVPVEEPLEATLAVPRVGTSKDPPSRPARKELGDWAQQVYQQTAGRPIPSSSLRKRSSPSSSLVPHSPLNPGNEEVVRPWIRGHQNGSLDMPRTPSLDKTAEIPSPNPASNRLPASYLARESTLTTSTDYPDTPVLPIINRMPLPPKKPGRADLLAAGTSRRQQITSGDSLVDPRVALFHTPPSTHSVVLDVVVAGEEGLPPLHSTSTSLSNESFTLSESAERRLFFRPPSRRRHEVTVEIGQVGVRRTASVVRASSLSHSGSKRTVETK